MSTIIGVFETAIPAIHTLDRADFKHKVLVRYHISPSVRSGFQFTAVITSIEASIETLRVLVLNTECIEYLTDAAINNYESSK